MAHTCLSNDRKVNTSPTSIDDKDYLKVMLTTPPVKKKKKLTRNQLKAQKERRRVRKLNWLTFGGPKPEDTDSD